MVQSRKALFILALTLLGLSGCVVPPVPSQVDNVCVMFKENPDWYRSARRTQRRWGVPIWVQMAIMHQESHFHANARPTGNTLFGLTWSRPSTAYGYAQILDTTWADYQHRTGAGGSRNRFSSVTNFIGWYANQAHKVAGVPLDDPYRLYLAYHEGAGGYKRKTYLTKPWLIKVARKVKSRAISFREQLKHCESRLSKGSWWDSWW